MVIILGLGRFNANLPGISGLELLEKVNIDGDRLPAIMISGHSDVAMVVAAMQAGAFDFIEKPIDRDELLVRHQQTASAPLDLLTAQQREIMTMMLGGRLYKNIAADINISQCTVENHRAEILKRIGVKSLLALLLAQRLIRPMGKLCEDMVRRAYGQNLNFDKFN